MHVKVRFVQYGDHWNSGLTFSLPLNELFFIFVFAITAASAGSFGGPKTYFRTPSIVQFIFYFWSFEISRHILGNILRFSEPSIQYT